MKLVGTLTERIVKETSQLLDDPETYKYMSRVFTPFGDGHASEKIAECLNNWLVANAGRETV
ncbi:UDP-N-acetylglucosamine 2-epimerase [compost metagenome]